MNKGTAARSLRELYRQKSDEELLSMWNSRANFTDIAKQALENVLHERKLPLTESAPVAVTASAESTEEHVGEAGKDEVVLQRFSDTMELNRVMGRLETAGIDFRIHDHTDRDSVALGNARPLDLWLIVKAADKGRANPLVLDAMGLEDHSGAENPFTTMQGLTVLGYFPRTDAMMIAQALGTAGISYLWNDPKDDPEADAGDDIGIEVRGTSLQRAQELVEGSLSAQ